MTIKESYTREELRRAFRDGVAAGIASQDGTFGGEDFMGEAWAKAEKFMEDWTYWEDLWTYCGGGLTLYGEPEAPPPRKKPCKVIAIDAAYNPAG